MNSYPHQDGEGLRRALKATSPLMDHLVPNIIPTDLTDHPKRAFFARWW
jgi:hypothetical protein